MREFNLKKFEKILEKCDFDYFKEKHLINVNLNNLKIEKRIMKIYHDLSSIKGIRFVGATKIMHILAPNFFMMWDTGIRKHYGFDTSPKSYLDFMKKMQELYKQGKFKKINKKFTIPRAIDMYNMSHC